LLVKNASATGNQQPATKEGSMANKSRGIVFLGAPGAGKGTQAVMVAKDLDVPHISSGDLFRDHLKRGTELGKLAQTFMDKGELVPDDVTIGMVKERLGQPDCLNGFILDGFPRTVPQAEALDAALAEMGKCISLVPYLRVRESMLMERLTHRWTCKACGAVFPYEAQPPRTGCKKEHCDGDLYQRADDNPETQKRRIEVYMKQTAPLITYYRQRGLLIELSGEHTIDYVYRILQDAIAISKYCGE